MSRPNLVHRVTHQQDRLLDGVRDRRALEAAGQPGTATDFAALTGARYALVVTFRRSRKPVPTPMWFGLDEGRVYVRSLADAGKVRRLRRDPHVRIAPCNLRGKPTGPFAEAIGEVVAGDENDRAETALNRHSGWGRRLYEGLGTRLAGSGGQKPAQHDNPGRQPRALSYYARGACAVRRSPGSRSALTRNA